MKKKLIVSIIGLFALTILLVGCTLSSYKVSFYNEDVLIETQTIEEGASAVAPAVNPTKDGYVFTGWDVDFTNVKSDLKVSAVFKAIETVNDARTVLTGARLIIPEGTTVNLESGKDQFAIFEENNTKYLVAQEAGITTVQLVTDEKVTNRTYTVINTVTSIALGNSLSGFVNETSKLEYVVNNKTEYFVGSADYYMIDLNVLGMGEYRGNDVFDYPQLDFGTYTLAYKLFLEDVEDTTNEYMTYDENGVKFKDAAVGKTFVLEVTLVPNQLQTLAPSSTTVRQTLTVNNGYNVHSNEEFKTEFANLDVHQINIHRNITAELSEDQYYTQGDKKVPYNHYSISYEAGIGKHGDCYWRYHDSSIGELVVNGNYFQIDGSGLPLLKGNDDDGSQGGFVDTQNPVGSRKVVTVQSAMFNIGVGNSAGANQSGSVTFKDLTIVGNTQAPQADALELSGGYMGVKTESCGVTVDNTIFKYQTTNIFCTNIQSTTNVLNSKLTNAWATNLLSWDTNSVYAENSYFAIAGGSSICVVDGSSEDVPTVLELKNSKIENYVTQNNPWFAAYSLNSIGTLVAGVENAIASINQAAKATGVPGWKDKTLLYDKAADITASAFNFAILVQNSNPADPGSSNTEPSAKIIIDGVTVYNPYSYANSNPLIGGVTSAGASFTPFGYDLATSMADRFAQADIQAALQGGANMADLVTEVFAECIITAIARSEGGDPTINDKYLYLMPNGFKCVALVELFNASDVD